ncbi:hypothetical protein GOP47_0027665 [Adiantum capillus-veneris]|nr:hypothetical protein GOP47_0030575 [Adiantum capillus-veneris]KAI5057650.1 hypothetical protein GOP47_0027665 [Adiantum capillus-veneris]
MDLFQIFLDLAIPPTGLFILLLCLPTVYFLRFLRSVLTVIFKENVRGKVVLITGASSGIGEQVAYQYARCGAILVLVARRAERLRAVAERASKLGAMHTHVITGDVAKEGDCKRVVDETIKRFGHLDHLVNNAGISHSFLFEEAPDLSLFHPVMGITFWGQIYPTLYALPHLRRTRGKIIVNASVVAWLPVPRMSIYNAAKAGIYNFYETLRIEIEPAVGITIVTPGYIESEMTKGKFMTREGRLVVDDEQRDIQVGPWPVEYAENCAKAMVLGALKGKRYVQVPAWFNVFILYRVFAPELIDWMYRFLYVEKTSSQGKLYSKAILDATGAKKTLYPPSIQS